MPSALLPAITDRNHYQTLFAEDRHWESAVHFISKRHGLQGSIQRGVLGSHIVYRIGDQWLKLMAPLFAKDMEHEVSGLLAIDGKLSVPTPRILEQGQLEDWRYIILSHVEGEAIRDAWPKLGMQDKKILVREMAKLTLEIHQCVPDTVIRDRFVWNTFIKAQYDNCESQQVTKGLTKPWLEEVGHFLNRFGIEEFLESRPVFLHADLTFDHFLVEQKPIAKISAIIDMADCQVGHAEYELVAPAAFILRGDSELLATYLLEYGFPKASLNQRFSEKLLAWCLLHRYFSLTRFEQEIAACPPGDFSSLATKVFPLELANADSMKGP